jgi:hypothetical protein
LLKLKKDAYYLSNNGANIRAAMLTASDFVTYRHYVLMKRRNVAVKNERIQDDEIDISTLQNLVRQLHSKQKIKNNIFLELFVVSNS